MVALAFLGPYPAGRCCNHKNGIKTDNRLENIEYVTAAENSRHAWRNGLCGIGRRAKLSREQVVAIKEKSRLGVLQRVIAEEFGITQSAVSLIVTGKNWARLAVAGGADNG
jgi:hypothetical protein